MGRGLSGYLVSGNTVVIYLLGVSQVCASQEIATHFFGDPFQRRETVDEVGVSELWVARVPYTVWHSNAAVDLP